MEIQFLKKKTPLSHLLLIFSYTCYAVHSENEFERNSLASPYLCWFSKAIGLAPESILNSISAYFPKNQTNFLKAQQYVYSEFVWHCWSYFALYGKDKSFKKRTFPSETPLFPKRPRFRSDPESEMSIKPSILLSHSPLRSTERHPWRSFWPLRNLHIE